MSAVRLLPLALLLAACGPSPRVMLAADGVNLQRVQGNGGNNGNGGNTPVRYVSLDAFVTTLDGSAVPCEDIDLDLELRWRFSPDDPWIDITGADLVEVCRSATGGADIALVLDNSGSQEAALDATVDGAQDLVDGIVAGGGRVSLTRVSTGATPLVPLTDDVGQLGTALDALFVTNGWTALWDGLRQGNDSLVDGRAPAPATELGAYCAGDVTTGIVAFTNGLENNSADEQSDKFTDSVDTTLDDVRALAVESARTPLHTIALGESPNLELLRDLSAESGGTHIGVSDEALVPEAFGLVADWIDATLHLCGQIETTECGPGELQVSYKCNQGLGNGSEGCDPGNSNNQQPSNDEPGSPGRGNGNGPGNTGATEVRVKRVLTVEIPCE